MSDLYLTQMEDQGFAKFMATCDNLCTSISNVQYSKHPYITALVIGSCIDIFVPPQEYITRKTNLHMNAAVWLIWASFKNNQRELMAECYQHIICDSNIIFSFCKFKSCAHV